MPKTVVTGNNKEQIISTGSLSLPGISSSNLKDSALYPLVDEVRHNADATQVITRKDNCAKSIRIGNVVVETHMWQSVTIVVKDGAECEVVARNSKDDQEGIKVRRIVEQSS